jgi:hypothetical protein
MARCPALHEAFISGVSSRRFTLIQAMQWSDQQCVVHGPGAEGPHTRGARAQVYNYIMASLAKYRGMCLDCLAAELAHAWHACAQVYDYIMASLAKYRGMYMDMAALLRAGAPHPDLHAHHDLLAQALPAGAGQARFCLSFLSAPTCPLAALDSFAACGHAPAASGPPTCSCSVGLHHCFASKRLQQASRPIRICLRGQCRWARLSWQGLWLPSTVACSLLP